MNDKDMTMMRKLIEDKGVNYRVMVDNDCVFVVDKKYDNEYDERAVIHEFNKYGWEFIVDIMRYLKLDCEEV